MNDCCDTQVGNPEMDMTVARVALGKGDTVHAAHHLAGALGSDPSRADANELWEQLRGSTDDMLELFPVAEEMWFGTAACAARAMAEQGRVDDAWPFLCQANAAAPHIHYVAWTRGWGLPSEDAVLASFHALFRIHDAALWEILAHSLCSRAYEAYPSNAQIMVFASIGARRGGDLDLSLLCAQSAVRADPTWFAYSTLANIHRERGEWDETIGAWEQALALDPADVTVLLDWGDTCLGRDEPEQARLQYKQALERKPGQPWAAASIRYLDWLAKPTVAAGQEVIAWCRQQTDSARAQWVADQCVPWRGYLPSPTDATANALAQLFEKGLEAAKVTVSHYECPSLYLTARRAFPNLTIGWKEIPTPHPSVPVLLDTQALFHWDGDQAQPALAAADPVISSRIAELAWSAFQCDEWLRIGAQLAKEFSGREADVLATAVNPPTPPDNAPPHHWHWRVQHAAAFVLASYPGQKGPHVDALKAMVSVRHDWLAIAALAAMCARGETDQEFAQTAIDCGIEVLKAPPSAGAFPTSTIAWHMFLRLDPTNVYKQHAHAISLLDAE
jgi:tetratricopeptide (TPR) repeat protein